MGQLTKSHLIEAGIWSLIAVIFFGFSFEFNAPIEIYKFGATGWPRVIILLLLIVTAGNLYHQYQHGSAVQKGRVGVGIAEGGKPETDYRDPVTLFKIGSVLLTPFIFAWLLKPVGFYAGSPFFIAAIIWLFGQRRWRWIIGVTLFIYVMLITLFVVVLNAPLPQGNTSPFYDYSSLILKLNTNLQQLW